MWLFHLAGYGGSWREARSWPQADTWSQEQKQRPWRIRGSAFAGLFHSVSYTAQAHHSRDDSTNSGLCSLIPMLCALTSIYSNDNNSNKDDDDSQHSNNDDDDSQGTLHRVVWGSNSSTVVLSSQVYQADKPRLAITSWKEILRGSLNVKTQEEGTANSLHGRDRRSAMRSLFGGKKV